MKKTVGTSAAESAEGVDDVQVEAVVGEDAHRVETQRRLRGKHAWSFWPGGYVGGAVMMSCGRQNWLSCLCMFAVAGFATAVHAEPGAQCGGFIGIPCEAGEYCETVPGECCCDFFGTCTTIPEVCTDEVNPVCGCDGQTYTNPCEADAAGVSINYEGECAIVAELCGGFIGLGCSDPNDFCLFPDGQCCCDQFGVCTETPEVCPAVAAPDCGCDGVTYMNRCEAQMAGVSVDHEGFCAGDPPQQCGGPEDPECPPGEYCVTEGGDCDGVGVCIEVPVICPLTGIIAIPVCGCDGKTYGSHCEAAQAGVSVDHLGPCAEGMECGGPLTVVCPDGTYCMREQGDCDGIGMCIEQPEICPLFFDPVCGCDGETYGNACEAAAAGTSVDYHGRCIEGQACGSVLGSPVDCPEGQYCQFPIGDCDALVGTCQDIPDSCPELLTSVGEGLEPFGSVCGCDGVTYDSACEAAAAGVSIAHAGVCEIVVTLCGLPFLPDCPDGEYCMTSPGGCDGLGTCQDVPEICPAVFDPVCGCDGMTYGNACQAAASGVSVDHEGVCTGGGGCGPDGEACPAGQYCMTPPGQCDADGSCAVQPDLCAPVIAPVCGCDGETYSNGCVAAAAGVSIAHTGACEDDQYCGPGPDGLYITCPLGAFCLTEPGECFEEGRCRPIPEFCPLIFAPVCGCDGETYSNACFAHAAGTSVDHEGPCDAGQPCGTGIAAPECPEDQYCMTAPGNCDGIGVCAEVPGGCPLIFAPVCGCDGTTYGNACLAASAGVSVDHAGPCDEPTVCGGIIGLPCDEGEYCMTQPGECCCDFFGVCQEIPEICPEIFNPVCGCDGVTYDNPCFAAAAGVSVDHPGHCGGGMECGGVLAVVCPDGTYCMRESGDCAGLGTCTDIPDLCPLIYAPVCGCDGVTYGNPCLAAAAGTSVDHDGPCNGDDQVCGDLPGLPPCPEGSFCDTPDGACDSPLGVCHPMPTSCPLVGMVSIPVCGCDGITYVNECMADAAGVSIDHIGACDTEPTVCGGFLGIPCEDGQYCMTPVGECCCDVPGVCQPIPEICPAIFNPVCGCDGQTYGNPCLAAAAGVSIDHAGTCEGEPQMCGGLLGLPCDDGEYCMTPTGLCCCDVPGVCAPIPEVCPDVVAPVCGCDGQTYGNACEAAAAGVSIDHDGACEFEQICGSVLGSPLDCPPDQYCMFPEGDCDALTGFCRDIPDACPLIFDPVCGCDGTTYSNRCFAALAGVSIDHEGACVDPPDFCGGFAGIPCPDGQYCQTPPGQCCCDIPGVCTDIPAICPLILDPVCGCDGETYGNPCLAAAAGVSIDHPGPCVVEPQICGGILGLPCDEGEFCKLPDGMCCCDIQGVCQPIPEICPLFYSPVCGCDGVTYGNECEASAAGVSVDFDGACEWVCNTQGDFDNDGDVDLADFGSFQLCYSGAGMPAGPLCSCGDFDEDGDVDLTDFAGFQLAFTGRGK